MGKSKDLEKKRAEWLYVERGYLQKDISVELDIPERTLTRWSKEGCWKEKRQAKLMGRKAAIGSVTEAISSYSQELNNAGQAPTVKEVRTLTSAVNALTALEGEKSFHISCEVLQGFAKYLLSANAPLAKELTPIIDAYLKDLLKYKA